MDVIFYEDIFPFSSSPTSPSSVFPAPSSSHLSDPSTPSSSFPIHSSHALVSSTSSSASFPASLSHVLRRHCGSSIVLLVVYVDDIILTGIEVAYVPSGLLLQQKKFIRDLLKEYHSEYVSSVTCPIDLNHKVKADMRELMLSPELHRSLGKLNFLTHIKPDLSFAVQHLNQFLHSPSISLMHVALHILRYLKGSSDIGVFISNSHDLSLSVYCERDWAACPDTRRSVTDLCILLGDSLVGWKANKQPVVSLSSAEVEHRAISNCN
uniref:Uncharacterized mitochondrial protein AtMg00810-like n=1 Tax=Nicotiana tabacum TaxID=4097 RepID=A0A1S4CVA4_TOBAC|nr:PREDICTED: uncharacterized mitochondrial protein AtMg00810-like [Nicotiana tabacum]